MFRLRPLFASIALAGWWVQFGFLMAAEPVNEAADWFTRAQRLVLQGDQGRAVERYKAIVRIHPRTEWAPKAQFEIALLFARNREHGDAFEAAQKLIEKFPESALYVRAIEIQFGVAERVAEEYRRRQLKKDKSQRGLPDRETASQMLRILLANARYTPHAPKAHYRLAVSLAEELQPEEAVKEFNEFLMRYPDDALADDAAFQIGFIHFKLARERNRERSASERAQMGFEEFLAWHPNSEKAPEARHLLATLNIWESDRLLSAARTYEAYGHSDAALRTYREWLAKKGESARSEEVTGKIKTLETKMVRGASGQ